MAGGKLGCFQMFLCQRHGDLMSGLGSVDTNPCLALFILSHVLLSRVPLPSLIWELCIYLGAPTGLFPVGKGIGETI